MNQDKTTTISLPSPLLAIINQLLWTSGSANNRHYSMLNSQADVGASRIGFSHHITSTIFWWQTLSADRGCDFPFRSDNPLAKLQSPTTSIILNEIRKNHRPGLFSGIRFHRFCISNIDWSVLDKVFGGVDLPQCSVAFDHLLILHPWLCQFFSPGFYSWVDDVSNRS